MQISVRGASGVTPVDGSPGQAFSDCYPVVLDGAVVGWVESELAPVVVDSLRRFKVCQLYKIKKKVVLCALIVQKTEI